MTATEWLDTFFELYYRRNPVNATFTGRHEHDGDLPDYSAEATAAYLAEIEKLSSDLELVGDNEMPAAARLDLKVAAGYLRIQAWELRSNHFQLGNPSFYTGETIFSILGLFLTNYAPIQSRAESAVSRMLKIPVVLEQAKANLTEAPAEWISRAAEECAGADQLFGNGLQLLAESDGIKSPKFLEAANVARTAFAEFATFLRDELSVSTDTRYQCGEETLAMIAGSAHFFDRSLSEIASYAETEMKKAQEFLAKNAGKFGAATPAEALAPLADIHPTHAGYLDHYSEVWNSCRRHAIDNDLVTWPDHPIRYVPRPAWARSASPHLYFLFYRSPASVNAPDEHLYLVEPIGSELPADEAEVLLRRNNTSVVKLNHVVHHGAIGHHVQNWHAARAASRLGRVAAIDCASRIAMLSGGSMAEGWACYATSLMEEHGFLTDLESYAEQQSRARMAARAVVDVKLHTGEFTLDQAATFYTANAGMPEVFARSEAVKNSMFPGGAMMYLIGMDLIAEQREKERARMGAGFDLKSFHDRFLSYGALPVQLICHDMDRKGALDAE